MSLWTPGGDVPIDRNKAGGEEPADPGASDRPSESALASAAEALGIDPTALSAEEREQLEAFVTQMAESQRRLAETPASELVANHAMGLYELAAIKLATAPPQLDDAKLAVDSLRALVESVGDRVGEHADALRQALTTIQMAWVQTRDQLDSQASDGAS